MTLPAFPMSNFIVSRKRLVFLCTILVIVGLAISFTWAGRQGLFALSADNQAFTELYINNSRDVPVRVIGGQKYDIPFTIVNQQHRTQSFTYRIVIVEQGKASHQPPRTVTLGDGQKTTGHVQFTAAQTSQDVTIYVQLQQPKQQLTIRVGQS